MYKLYSQSPSSSLSVGIKIKEGSGSGGDAPAHIIDVWRSGLLLRSFDCSTVHGPVDLGDTLGGLSWSADDTFFVYVAEMKEKKGLSYYASEDGPKGTLHAHREDYGEQMSGATAPQLFKFSVADGRSVRGPLLPYSSSSSSSFVDMCCRCTCPSCRPLAPRFHPTLWLSVNPRSCITRHTSHITRHTSHITRHTSHVTHHTSHVTGDS